GGDGGKRPACSRGDASRRRPAGGDDAGRGSPLASATMDATFGSARAAPERMATSCPTAGWRPRAGAPTVVVAAATACSGPAAAASTTTHGGHATPTATG